MYQNCTTRQFGFGKDLNLKICQKAPILPFAPKNSWVMCAGLSTQIPMMIMRLVADTVSIVNPGNKTSKCQIPNSN